VVIAAKAAAGIALMDSRKKRKSKRAIF